MEIRSGRESSLTQSRSLPPDPEPSERLRLKLWAQLIHPIGIVVRREAGRKTAAFVSDFAIIVGQRVE